MIQMMKAMESMGINNGDDVTDISTQWRKSYVSSLLRNGGSFPPSSSSPSSCDVGNEYPPHLENSGSGNNSGSSQYGGGVRGGRGGGAAAAASAHHFYHSFSSGISSEGEMCESRTRSLLQFRNEEEGEGGGNDDDSSRGDFRTVDCWYDSHEYRRQINQMDQNLNGWRGLSKRMFLKMEGWVSAALIAVLTACSAAYIDIGVQYFADLRIGVCSRLFWLDRRYCCGSEFAVNYRENRCEPEHFPNHENRFLSTTWMSWSTLFHLQPDTIISYMVEYFFYLIIATLLAVCAAGLVLHFNSKAAGSGIPEVKTILGGFVMKGVLGGWTLIIKCVGLCLAVASGLSLGKEGPLVHVACCWANLASRFSTKYHNNEAKKRELLSAASAAGVSVAFGAPLGGVLFSLEEVSTYFPPKTLWKSFFCAVIAALVLKWLDPEGTGKFTMFQMDYVSLLGSWDIIELIPFALLGFIGGVLGAVFIHLNVRWNASRKSHPFISKHPVLEVTVVVLCTAVVNYLVPMLRGTSSHLLGNLFARCGSDENVDPFKMCTSRDDPTYGFSDYSLTGEMCMELIFVMLMRSVQTVFTFGIGVPAGIFIPSLTIGACFGRLMGILMIKLNEVTNLVNCRKCLHPGVYALVGAASMLGGVTRMTISLVVIMFELTGGLSYVVPFMVAVMISKWVGDAICEHGIYDCYIRLRGYPYLQTSEEVTFTARACDIMETRLVVAKLEGNTIGSFYEKLRRYGYSGFPLVNTRRDMILLGYLPVSDLCRTLQAASRHPDVKSTTPVKFLKFSSVYSSQQPSRSVGVVGERRDGGEARGLSLCENQIRGGGEEENSTPLPHLYSASSHRVPLLSSSSSSLPPPPPPSSLFSASGGGGGRRTAEGGRWVVVVDYERSKERGGDDDGSSAAEMSRSIGGYEGEEMGGGVGGIKQKGISQEMTERGGRQRLFLDEEGRREKEEEEEEEEGRERRDKNKKYSDIFYDSSSFSSYSSSSSPVLHNQFPLRSDATSSKIRSSSSPSSVGGPDTIAPHDGGGSHHCCCQGGGDPFIDFSDIVDEHAIQLVPETPLGQVYNIFRQLGLRFCLLTRHGRLEGLLTKKTFLAHLDLAHPTDAVPNFPNVLPNFPNPNE